MAQQGITKLIIENLKKALMLALVFALVITANVFPPQITNAQFSDGEEEEEIVENPDDTDFSDGEEEEEEEVPTETPDDTDFSDGEEEEEPADEPDDTDFSDGEEEEEPADEPDDTDFSDDEEEDPADEPDDSDDPDDTDFSDGEEEEDPADEPDDTDFSDGEEEDLADEPVADNPVDEDDGDTDFSDGEEEEEPADEPDDTDFSDGNETPEAAEITNITVSKTVINEADAGQQFFVGVVFDAPMDITVNPVISFIPDVSSTLSFVSGSWNPEATTYTATFDVTDSGTEFSGIDVMVTGATDANAQAVAQDMIIDAFSIDMIAPVVSLAYDPDGVVFGNSFVTVTASLSEALVNTPQIGIDAPGENSDVSEADFTATDDILVWTFVWGLQDTGEGIANLTVTGSDVGGNNIGTVINDTRTIGIVDTPAVNAPIATALVGSDSVITESDTGTNVTFAVTFDTEMDPTVVPTISFSPSIGGTLGNATGVWSANNTIYTYSYIAADTDQEITGVDVTISGAQSSEGIVMVLKTFTDIFEIDTRGPDAALTYNPDRTVNDNDIVRITVTFDEAIGAGTAPTISLNTPGDGDTAPTNLIPTADPLVWTFDWNVPSGSDENGAVLVTITATDTRGNTMQTDSTREIDNGGNGGGGNPPPFVDNDKPVVIATTPSDTLLTISDELGVLSIAVVFNEAMNQQVVPSIGFNPGSATVIGNEAGSWTSNNTYTFTYDILDSDTEIGNFVATITGAEDVAGNVMDTHTTAVLFDVDTVAPTITLAYDPSFEPVGNGDVVTITGTLSEALTGAPRISLVAPGDGDFSFNTMTATADPLVWTFVWSVPGGSDDNGVGVFSVTGEDNAGNSIATTNNAERTIANVVGDVTPANITSLSVSDVEIVEADAGQQFTVTVTFDEVMNENITPVISFLPDVSGTLVADTTDWMNQSSIFRATYTMTDNDAEVSAVDVRMDGAEDLAGNVASHLAVDKFDIDLRGPLVTLEFVPNAAPYEAGDAIVIVANFDETPGVTPQISIATNGDGDTALTDMTATQNNPLRFTFTWLVPSGADEDGTATVTVTGDDSVGNGVRSILNNTTTIDNTPGGGGNPPGDTTAPLVSSVVVSDQVITEIDAGNVVTVTTTFNEAMDQTTDPVIAFTENITTTLTATGTPAWLSNTQYQVSYEVADVNVEMMNIGVTVSGAQDTSANTMTAFTSTLDVVQIDTIAPSIFLAYNPDNILTGSSTVVVTATVSEALVGEPTLVIATPAGVVVNDVLAIVPAPAGGIATYAFEWDVPEGNQHNGEVNLTVRATDVLGNTNVDEAANNTREINNPGNDPAPNPDPVPDPDPQPQPTPSGGGGGGGGGGGAAPAFSNPLSVFDFRATRISPDAAVITWTSNLSATRQVFYGTESVVERVWTEKFGYQFETVKGDIILEKHSVLLTGLDPAEGYFVRGASNLPGNRAVATSELFIPVYGEITSEHISLEGSQCTYLFDFLGTHLDTNNIEEVRKLQTFLNQFEGEVLAITTEFDDATFAAVKRFQTKYRADILDPWGTPEATGFVYITTKKKINEIVCGSILNFTAPESAEIEAYKNRGTLEVAETPDIIGGLRPASPTEVVTVPTTGAKSLKVKGYDVDALLISAPNAEEKRKERFILPGSVIHSIPGLLFFR